MMLYKIVENEFHGGAHIAYARTLETAARAYHRHDRCSRSGCCCGGPCILHADGSELNAKERYMLDVIFYEMSCGRISKR